MKEIQAKTKSFWEGYREFISRGNVVEMAVGIIIGAAFTSIVNSLVKEIIMPMVGYCIGGINFTDFKFVLRGAVGEDPEVAVLWGSFLQQVVNFFIIALIVFIMVKGMNALRSRKEEEPQAGPEPSLELTTLMEIRDILKQK